MRLIFDNQRLIKGLFDLFLGIETSSFIKKSKEIVQLIVNIAVVDCIPEVSLKDFLRVILSRNIFQSTNRFGTIIIDSFLIFKQIRLLFAKHQSLRTWVRYLKSNFFFAFGDGFLTMQRFFAFCEIWFLFAGVMRDRFHSFLDLFFRLVSFFNRLCSRTYELYCSSSTSFLMLQANIAVVKDRLVRSQWFFRF